MTQTIVVTEFLSLDGVMEAPNEWNIPYVDETLGADIQGELDRATANRFNDLPKYVVSSTLRETSWAPTTILRGDAVAVMKELKSSGDGRILVWGSRQLVQTMAAARLVDEYVLYVHPLVLGKGAHLFAEGHHQDLELTSAKTYARGVVALRLRPRAK